jgi:hypothetical protein
MDDWQRGCESRMPRWRRGARMGKQPLRQATRFVTGLPVVYQAKQKRQASGKRLKEEERE